MISPILAVLGALALVGAYLTDSRTLAGLGFALAVIGAVMGLATWLLEPAGGRKKDQPAEEGEPPEKDEAVVVGGDSDDSEASEGPVDSGEDGVDPDDSDTVWVITGRKRYHRRDCALLGQREAEAHTVGAAQAQGFTACSACAR